MKTVFTLLFLAASLMLKAEPEIRRYTTPEELKRSGFSTHTTAGHLWNHTISADEKTPAGDASLAFTVTATPEGAQNWHKHVNFVQTRGVEKGQRYRLSFYYKGSVPGKIFYGVCRQTPPYTAIGKQAGRNLNVTTAWQEESREFTVDETVPGPLAMPRFNLGLLPAGAVFSLGPISLERLDRTVSGLLTPDWRYQVESGKKLPVDRIPEGTRPAKLENNLFDLGKAEKRFGNNAAALFYQEFDAPADGNMTVGMAADWWFECFINGEPGYNTLGKGNMSQSFAPENHVFNLPVKKGKNLIAVRVISGSAGWRFVSGTVPPFDGNPELARLFKPEAGEKFRPVDDARFLEVKPGTALDLTNLVPRDPAGTFGRLVIAQDGKPVFEKRPGIPVRFHAFNFMLGGMWRNRYHEWDKATIDRFADAVMRQGYNQVRIHIPEIFLFGFRAYGNPEQRKKTLKDVKIPQTVAELEANLDLGNLDRMDYFIAAFKKRGIYVNLDLAGRIMITGAVSTNHADSFKGRLFYDPVCRAHWKLFTEYLMKRVNPYTKAAYKDEPAIVLINFINEQDLRFADGLHFLTTPFRDWLKKKYGTDAALTKAWGIPMTFDAVPDITENDLRPGDRRAVDTGDFLQYALAEMSGWYQKTLREAGYPGLTTHWDMIMRTLELPARALLPVVSQHTYFAHPNTAPIRGLIPKSVRPNSFVGNQDSDCVVPQGSSFDSSYFRAAAAARFLDRPYFVTEYSHCSPNRYRHERGLYFSSYAALQDWDCLTTHGDTVRLTNDPFLRFDGGRDPISRVNEYLAALIYLRGDVKMAPHSVALELKSDNLFPKHYLSAIGDDYAKLALVTRLGLLYPEIKPFEPVGKAAPTLTLLPEEFSYLRVSQWYVAADASSGKREAEFFNKLREKGILGPNNPTDPAKRLFVSETGELTLNGAAQTFAVVTPRLEGAVLKKNAPFQLGRLAIRSCTRPASVAVAALDGEKTIPEANRLVLIFATNAFNTGQIFNSDEQQTCYESGNHPALIEAAQLDLTLDDGRSVLPEIHALHFDGTRAEAISASRENGKLRIKLDTARLKQGAAFFEINYP